MNRGILASPFAARLRFDAIGQTVAGLHMIWISCQLCLMLRKATALDLQ